jgi:hypothetical protein
LYAMFFLFRILVRFVLFLQQQFIVFILFYDLLLFFLLTIVSLILFAYIGKLFSFH